MQQRISIVLILIMAAVALATPARTSAAAPLNDDFDSATVIGSLPFQETLGTTMATTAGDDPDYSCAFGREATVWYMFTPTQDTRFDASTLGSDYTTSISVYTGWRGALNMVTCGSSQVDIIATAGQTYYFMAAANPSPYPAPGSAGGTLVFSLRQPPVPPNDQFANATTIAELPYSTAVDLAAAGVEAGEPTPLCNATGLHTAWYAFTPSTSGSYSASFDASMYWWSRTLAVYSGTALDNLHELGCHGMSIEPLTVHMDAGVTYYYQLVFGDPGLTTFYLNVAPAPQASMYYYPSDPSTFDTIQFINNSYDPGGAGFQTSEWRFGDGSASSENNPLHRYVNDGDYTVQLAVTTMDGRSASISQLIRVKTHDVAIAKLAAPRAASAGQTRQVTVGISSKRYQENVQVQLYKSVPGDFVLVGTLTQTVPVRSSNRTTDFAFSYSFTGDDAIIGKVTFKAVATILDARDVLPADNESIAPPTKIGKS